MIVGDEFLASVHNAQNCIGCHGGVDGEDDKDAAHEGVVRDPLEDSDRFCGVCHVDATRTAATSLHQNLTGYHTILTARGADFEDPGMNEAFDNHCYTCHATCGQCHISRPNFTFGGLIQEHKVKEVASMKDTCMACHGTRVSNEYQGKNEGVEGSVHWLEEGMSCFECHDVSQYHGDGTADAYRYEGPPGVNCLDCHSEAARGEGDILEHNLHVGDVACEVCHVSGPYKNCYNCHVGLDEKGLPYYETDESRLAFKIGLNPLKSDDRPWDYVLVRHVPVAPDTFAFYGDDLLPTFDNLPTWKYATPHNIQRTTAQNVSCESCHGSTELFLTANDIAPEELQANSAVIVEEAPTLPHPGLVSYKMPQACVRCHPRAGEGDWELADENIHSLNWVVEPAGEVILCEDCHSAGGNFDWAAAGYSDDEAAQFIWADYPPIKPIERTVAPSSAPYWVLGVGVVIVTVTVVLLLIRRRNGR